MTEVKHSPSPCPFCGEADDEAFVVNEDKITNDDYIAITRAQVACMNCGACGPEHYDCESDESAKSGAFYAWNNERSDLSKAKGEAALPWNTDMDAAPKDGTWFEAYRPKAKLGSWDRIVIIRWHEELDDFVWPDLTFDVYFDDIDKKDNAGRYEFDPYQSQGSFTAWRPLPSPHKTGE